MKRVIQHTRYFFAAGLAVAVVALGWQVSQVQAASHSCGNPTQMYITEPTTTALALEQPVVLESTVPGEIERVTFLIDNEVLGVAEYEGTSSGGSLEHWEMIWDTRLSLPKSYSLRAEIEMHDNMVCVSSPVNVIDSMPFLPSQQMLVPQDWTGPTNFSKDFELVATGPGAPLAEEISDYVDYEWSISGVGFIDEEEFDEVEYSSPVPGTGVLSLSVRYGGLSNMFHSNITVTSQYAPPNDDDDDDSDEGSQSGSGNSSDEDDDDDPLVELIEPEIEPSEAITQTVRSSEKLRSCIDEKLENGLEPVLSANRRPTTGEFRQYLQCFSDQNFIIPTSLVPVAPEDVQNTRQSNDVVIGSIFNRQQQKDGVEQTTLVLSGQAAPNSTVFIYVFSEPLVLVATADENGNWEYALEDPLPSGEHEVYALVDKGDGEYERSSFASFFVGTAEATESNPNGYSLELVSEPTIAVNNRSVNVFIASTIGITVFALTAFSGFLIYRYRNRNTMVTGGPTSTDIHPIDDASHDT